ncbi:EF-hand calcium-binding domain-containing protein 4B-like isoform X2 [Oratosquilla oratoria]|uniref:EF-hand calcium-binding domain-containing protein 4B-like isoform X2 n=1 Tax=Oratosquilla oratoria TaxID=337810 RepID=UPI003F75B70B
MQRFRHEERPTGIRLWGELPLSPDELEKVFDSLDQDHNGYLTLDEFTDGFGSHLGLVVEFRAESSSTATSSPQSSITGLEVDRRDSDLEEQRLTDMSDNTLDILLDKLSGEDLESNFSMVQAVWQQLVDQGEGGGGKGGGGGGGGSEGGDDRGNAAEANAGMARLVAALLQELTRTKTELKQSEADSKMKAERHKVELHRLYEELEVQIRSEREKAIVAEKERSTKALSALESEVANRGSALDAMDQEVQDARRQIEKLQKGESSARHLNSQLTQQIDNLEMQLSVREDEVNDLRDSLEAMRKANKDERRQRATRAFKVSEGIAKERESLVSQLDILRNMNSQLRDEFDVIERSPRPTASDQGERCSDILAMGSNDDQNSAFTATQTTEETSSTTTSSKTPLPTLGRPVPTPRTAVPISLALVPGRHAESADETSLQSQKLG